MIRTQEGIQTWHIRARDERGPQLKGIIVEKLISLHQVFIVPVSNNNKRQAALFEIIPHFLNFNLTHIVLRIQYEEHFVV
jgi:hypothetical protein